MIEEPTYKHFLKVMNNPAYKQLDQENKKLCKWVNDLSEALFDVREESEFSILKEVLRLKNLEDDTRWRDCSKEIPEDDKECLTFYDDGEVGIDSYNHSLETWDDCFKPIFWKPINLPSKGVEK